MHLFLAPFLAGIVLVKADQVSIVSLIQCNVADGFQITLANFIEDVLTGSLSTH